MSDTKTERSTDVCGVVSTPNLRMAWSETPWDSAIFGFTVLQITDMKILGPNAGDDLAIFEQQRDALGTGVVSCRLSHTQLKESMLLETHGFRFIEMVYKPEFHNLATHDVPTEHGLTVRLAEEGDLQTLLAIAGSAFQLERFHADPRLDDTLGDIRYQGWVKSALGHPNQRLYVVHDSLQLVAFFVTEMLSDGTCYWHLNAVAPEAQGRGYGRRAWQAMLQQAHKHDAKRVQTCIVAHNYRVLNLYARLDFHFPSPLMTFHWVKEH